MAMFWLDYSRLTGIYLPASHSVGDFHDHLFHFFYDLSRPFSTIIAIIGREVKHAGKGGQGDYVRRHNGNTG
jgi:hypothetical protein